MDIERYAAAFSPDLVNELDRAEKLARESLYTEAAIRLGRGVEAALYEAARELSIDLTNRVIEELERIQTEVRTRQVDLLRKQTREAVRELANLAKQLAESIARLTEDQTLLSGRLDDRPRPNEQLLRELIAKADDDSVRRRLLAGRETLRVLQERRNRAAHASVTGGFIEFSSEEYEEMRTDADTFIEYLLDVMLGARGAKFWGEEVEVTA